MELANEVFGTGPLAIVIHGITESRESYRPILAELGKRYTVLAVDLRGHGLSTTDVPYDVISLATDVYDTLLSVELAGSEVPPLVIGHSLGGMVASAYAAIFPSRGVINIDQPLRLAAFKDGLGQLEPLLRGDQASFDMAIGLVFESMFGPLSQAEITRLNTLRRADQDVVLGIWSTIFESSPDELDATVEGVLSGVSVPYLALHGMDIGDEYASWLTARVPTATVEVWPSHGHYPHLVDSSRFLERVKSFDPTI